MPDLNRQTQGTQPVQIVDENTGYSPDIIFEDGLKKIAVSKKVQVDSLSGLSASAQNSIKFEGVAENDTLEITIQPTPSSPLFNKTFTVLAAEDRFTFAARVVLELNQDFVNFQPYFKATQVRKNSVIIIEAKVIAEAGENTAQDSFTAVGTGTIATSLQREYDNFASRRSIVVQASKSSEDGRIGIFGISGTVESKDASVEGLYIQKPYNGVTTEANLNVDGSVTPQVFTFPMDALDDLFINEIKFFGRDNGIQFSNFLGLNGSLANGILIEIKTNDNMITLPPIKTTDDFDDVFAFGGSNFDVYFASGADKFSARFLASAFPLRRSGSFGVGNDDYIRITVRDNLTSVTYLQAIVSGFRQEA